MQFPCPDGYVLAFTDRPVRKTAMVPYREFVKDWPKAFDEVNPNATISYYDKDKKYHGNAVELIDPKVENGNIVFTIKALDNMKVNSKSDLGETAVFIDGGDGMIPKSHHVMEIQHSGMSSPKHSDDDKKCTFDNKCKAKEEPMPVEKEKKCSFENKCKPKEEPMPVEEEKECTMPKCQAK